MELTASNMARLGIESTKASKSKSGTKSVTINAMNLDQPPATSGSFERRQRDLDEKERSQSHILSLGTFEFDFLRIRVEQKTISDVVISCSNVCFQKTCLVSYNVS